MNQPKHIRWILAALMGIGGPMALVAQEMPATQPAKQESPATKPATQPAAAIEPATQPSTAKPQLHVTFEDTAAGAVPEGWHVEAIGAEGKDGTWAVKEEAEAPSGKHVLSIVPGEEPPRYSYNVLWTDQLTMKNGRIEVKLRPEGGEQNQGGGVIWRVKDPGNFYVCRYDPSYPNFRVYRMLAGERERIATGTEVPAVLNEWVTLAVETKDDEIIGYFNGEEVLRFQDTTHMDAGAVGVWTKADGKSSFDDFRVTVAE